jgi:tetratricopeptide (TPR) repeat protein
MLLVAIAVGWVRAGFYDPREPTLPRISPSGVKPLPYDQFLSELGKLALVGNTQPLKVDVVPNAPDELDKLTALTNAAKQKAPRLAVLRERDQLLSRGRDKLSPTELATLAALQWRLGDSNAALESLRLARDRAPDNFWELTHRGSIYQGLRQYREALSNLELAARVFPSPWPGGSQATGDFFKKVEGYQLKLVQLRERESLRTGGRPTQATDVDALFDIRLVGPSGSYEAGKITGKVPPDAIPIVQTLLIWFPDDNRLLWLLAELYNGEGNLEAALAIMDQFGWARGSEGAVVRDHRRIIRAAYDKQAKSEPVVPVPAESAPQPTAPPPPAEILPRGWQLYTVGGIFGLLLLALGYWQVSEWRRRMRGPAIR